VRSPLPDLPQAAPQSSSGPWIPTDVLDAASQRFYVFGFYVALWAWKLYDFYTLALNEDDSLWLALKWFFIDTSFMFGIPLFGIPWLEWSNTGSFLLSISHTILDFMLMLRIGVPLQSWAVALVAFMWDSELAISERSVKPGPIVHNASLILGKQIINILPEGYVAVISARETMLM
jgi:nucleoporin POM152